MLQSGDMAIFIISSDSNYKSRYFLGIMGHPNHQCPKIPFCWRMISYLGTGFSGYFIYTTEMSKGEEGLENIFGTVKDDNEAHGQA
jgi:hypothetical protein